nr:zinc-regulated transporter 1 [Quercus suber]
MLTDASLLDPAYSEIGPDTCVGLTGGWSQYSFVPALALASCMTVFLMDFAAERYVEKKYGLAHGPVGNHDHKPSVDAAMLKYSMGKRNSTHAGHQHLHSSDQDGTIAPHQPATSNKHEQDVKGSSEELSITDEKEVAAERAFKTQIAAFLILEFGVIFHSVIIGLTLGTAGPDDFATLYPVIVFHQSFEGMGIGARLSAIQFPKRVSWMPWFLCAAYGLTTPIAIAIGLGVRTTYNSGSFTANVVSGVLDAISAGILLYTGLVELLARDFLFNPDRTNDDKQLAFMMVSTFLGAGIMALLGKWA